MLDVEVCKQKLQGFVDQVCAGQSPLYEFLCREIPNDAELFNLVRLTPLAQPGPNLFLAAVHFLLLRGEPHELREFYGTCTDSPRPANASFSPFRDFCLRHQAEIAALMASRLVQTNEVRRCAYWFPAFRHVHSLQPKRPLALIEVGASAGLNLNWDRYAYDYGPVGQFGHAASTVKIASEWRGKGPPLSANPPPVTYRVGIDLDPIDVSDEQQSLWLQSLIWPDQPERRRLLQSAIDDFRQHPAAILSGSALVLLAGEISNAPADAALCVYHSHTLNQFSHTERGQFEQVLREASHERSITHLSAEWIKTPQAELRLESWRNGSTVNTLLAEVDHHGRWIEWAR